MNRRRPGGRLTAGSGLLAAGLALSFSPAVSAALVFTSIGTSAPPATLGGHAMQAFPPDASDVGTPTVSLTPPAAAPVSGLLGFSTELIHLKIGDGWETWSHGFGGAVYHFDELVHTGDEAGAAPPSVTLTLPGQTQAFSFHLEPAFFGPEGEGSSRFEIGVTSLAGESIFLNPEIEALGGASGFGFHIENDPSDAIHSITIRGLDTWPDGWAVGEFKINSVAGVPDGGSSVLLLALSLSGLFGAARRLS